MIWFTSDLHFGHKNVLKYNRPFKSLDEMHEALVTNWNNHVCPDDVIYVLGDLALCPFREFEPIARRLQGQKILVQGNHDHYSAGQYARLGFTVYQEIKMKLAGYMVRLSHYPYAPTWYQKPFKYKSELRYLERRPPKVKGEFLLHGHVHTKYKRRDNRIHVGVDAHGYCPVSAREVESLMERSTRNRLG